MKLDVEHSLQPEHHDVVIIGAGLSGIGAAYYLQNRCPAKTYTILEAREALGGTWDLFRYPGVRSDSDMYTLGYSFRPWVGPKAIVDGPSILEYLRATTVENGIDRHIRYRMRVESARWSTAEGRWTVEALSTDSGQRRTFTCEFLWACTGYYRYQDGHTPAFPGRERFRGRIVHPQHWTEDIDYQNQKVVVIGSGATAVTLVPALAEKAAHVTMLQRSPTYVVSRPSEDASAAWLRARFPTKTAYALTRWKNVLLGVYFYQLARRRPERFKRMILDQVRTQVGDTIDVDRHFVPRYRPWDQRLCLVPDGDLFAAIKTGRVSVMTDEIDRFTETGIRLRSGQELPADLIVTATGLELQLLGGAALEVDGRKIDPARSMMYKGTMLSEVPNFALCIGYTNASWTLRAELSCDYVCRLLGFMEAHGYTRCCPRRGDAPASDEPFLGLASGYIQRASHLLPKQGRRAPWRTYQNYVVDKMTVGRAPIDDGILELARDPVSAPRPEPASASPPAQTLPASYAR
jgi:monooxygenase